MSEPICRIYLITPQAINPKEFRDQLSAALGAGDVGALQLRLKEIGDDEIRRAIDILLPISKAHKVPFILNDRPDLAREMGCDGVHLGQQDMCYQTARTLIGEDAIIGMTCHNSKHLAMEAAEKGADYVAFGAFFQSASKKTKLQASVSILHWWQELMLTPCVAIGGITPENGASLVRAGADFLAVIDAVWNYPEGPAKGVKALNSMMLA